MHHPGCISGVGTDNEGDLPGAQCRHRCWPLGGSASATSRARAAPQGREQCLGDL